MDLKQAIQQVIKQSVESMQLTDLRIGTVVKTSPLEISINAAMSPLKSDSLYLTQAVQEKKLIAPPLSNLYFLEGENELPHDTVFDDEHQPVYDWADVNRGLKVRDKVLLLRVQKGQKFIVLSRIV